MLRFVETVIRFRWPVIVVTLAITVLAVFQAKNLRVIIDPNTVLPQSHPYVAATNEVEELFGSKYVVVIGVTPKTGDVLQPAILEKVQRITAKLLAAPGVVKENLLSVSARRVKNIVGTPDGMEVRPLMAEIPRSAEQLAQLKKAIADNPVYLNSIVSADFTTAAILAEFQSNGKSGFNGMMNAVNPIVDAERDASVDIAVAGLPAYLSRIETYSQRMALLFPLAVLIIGLIHFEAFRTVQALILPLVTALLAVVWGLGVMGAAGVPLDVFNASTPILILAVAAGHAVQLLKRYYEEHHRIRDTAGLSPREANRRAVVQSLTRIGPVMLTAGTIASLGFFSLVIFDIVSVRTFGIFTGIGILSALTLEMTFIPALRSLLRAPGEKERRAERERRIWDRITGAVADWIQGPRRARLFLIVGLLIALATFGATRVVIDNSTKSLFSPDLPFQKDDRTLNARLGGTNTLYVLVTGKQNDSIKDPRTLETIDAAQRYLETQPYVGKTLSIADFIKRMNRAMHGDDPAQYRIPPSRELISQYLLLYSMSGEPGDFDSYVDNDYRSAKLTVFLKTDSTAYCHELIDKLQRFVSTRFGGDVHIGFGGSVPQSTALNDVMVHSKLLNMIQIGSAVFIISSLVFRSLVAGMLVLTPLVLAVLANFGLMGLTGIKLNIPNSLASAMAVGIGADYAIYLIYRMREELKNGADESTLLHQVLATAGKASLFVASAVAGGYSVLLLSFGFYMHTWQAILIATAMLTSVTGALTLVPALILQFRPRFMFGKSAAKLQPAPATVLTIAVFVVAAAVVGRDVSAADLSAEQIMDKNFVVSKVVDSMTDATLVLINKSGQERVRKTFVTTKLQGDSLDNMRMTRFLSPADVKGTVSLIVEHSKADDDIWIYLPALKKVRRLVASNKRDSFVGTDFSYGDVIGHKVNEWKHTLLREETLDGQAVYVVESVPASETVKTNSGYSKRVSWIRKDNFVAVRIDAWDEFGQPVKSYLYKDTQLVDPVHHRWQSMHLEAENVQTGHRTVISLEHYRMNQHIKDDYFTTRYMERDS